MNVPPEEELKLDAETQMMFCNDPWPFWASSHGSRAPPETRLILILMMIFQVFL